MRARGLVIAIDGPSGAGKSTAGRTVAERLGYTFIDTGAMYRALALRALDAHVDIEDEEAVAALARATRIELGPGGAGVWTDGVDVSSRIRGQAVSAAASAVSRHPAVRRELVAQQQALGRDGGVVLDGRDIGTQVFPDAEVKFFVDADPRRRAERRQRELAAMGRVAHVSVIEREIVERDRNDATRADSPLVRAPDAVHVDTSNLTSEQVADAMMRVVRARLRG